MANIEQRGELWTVRWRDGGRGGTAHRRAFPTRWEAERFLAEIQETEQRGERYEPGRPGPGPTPLARVLTDYVLDVRRRRAPNTAIRYAQMLELYRRWVGDATVEVLSFATLSSYDEHLRLPETGRHLHRRGPETVRKHIEAIELMWKWAWQRQARGTYHGVPQPDSLGLERQAAERRLAPTWGEMDAAIGCSDGWVHDLLLVMRCTGLRVSQAMGLRWDDLHLDAEVPWLRFRGQLGKTKQERRGRVVPLAPVLVHELSGWGRREGWVLECPRGRREGRVRDAVRAWERAGVDSELWRGRAHHAFRAGFQSGLRRAGADPDAIEHLVGHTRGDVVERYVDPDALPLVEAVALVPEIGITIDNVRRIGVQ